MERLTVLRGRSDGGIRAAAAILAGVCAVLASGCGSVGRHAASPTLLDGSTAPPLPHELSILGRRVVRSRVRVTRASRLDRDGRSCLDAFRDEFELPAGTVVVERTSAVGESLTFRDARRQVVLGCDRTARAAARPDPWCARSVGQLFSGRLRDPRVDILCRDRRGRPVGFAWIEPSQNARWVVVRDGSAVEVEETRGGLPVRVATSEVDIATSSATFVVTEYDAGGRKVRGYRLRAGVAG